VIELLPFVSATYLYEEYPHGREPPDEGLDDRGDDPVQAAARSYHQAGPSQHEEGRDRHTRHETNQQPTPRRFQFSSIGRPVDPEQPAAGDHPRDDEFETQCRGGLPWYEHQDAYPTLVALTEIGLRNGTMLRENAAALVGAGVLTVLVLPALAVALQRPRGTAALDSSTDSGGPHQVPAE
jgi:hypothetical protein